jgi:hypothetical protein
MAIATIQVRRDSSANWTAKNPVLAAGEWGLELDTTKLKIGNGTQDWQSLPYWAPVGGAVDWSSIANRPTTFPPEAHTHEVNEVTGLQAALDEKLTQDEADVLYAPVFTVVDGGGA